MTTHRDARRTFLLGGAGALLGGCAVPAGGEGRGREEDEQVSPVEDLMREHGALRRVLLVYDEIGRRIAAREPFSASQLAAAAGVVRRFVEDYHERLEEDLVFPRFEQAGQKLDLIATLRRQHQAGRAVTDRILALASEPALASDDARAGLRAELEAFARMYRPHSAREDTVLFPALRPLVGAAWDALGEAFEDRERALFGARGFEGVVAEVAQIEAALGILDLSRFTPG